MLFGQVVIFFIQILVQYIGPDNDVINTWTGVNGGMVGACILQSFYEIWKENQLYTTSPTEMFSC